MDLLAVQGSLKSLLQHHSSKASILRRSASLLHCKYVHQYRLSKLHTHVYVPEKEMAAHSSVLAWRTPGMKEPGGLLSMGSHRVGHDRSDLAAAAGTKEMMLLNFRVG